MKQDQLLDAVGMVDEHLLEELEKPSGSGSRGVWTIVLIAAIITTLVVSVAAVGIHFVSKHIKSADVTVDKEMDGFIIANPQGDMIPGTIEGQLIFMEVDFNDVTPAFVERVYVLDVPAPWQGHELYGGSGDGFVFYDANYSWVRSDSTETISLNQMVRGRHDYYGENCVDVLYNLKSTVQLTKQVVTMAGLEVLKITVPAISPEDGAGTYPNAAGETRLYWSDGDYIMSFIYPASVTDAEAEAMLQTLRLEDAQWSYPEDYGTVSHERFAGKELPFVIQGDGGMVGRAATGDGCIWFISCGYLNRYDPQTDTLKQIWLAETFQSSLSMFATENYICFEEGNRLWRVSKDGRTLESVCEGVNFDRVDGMKLYMFAAGSETLNRVDLHTGQEEIVAHHIKSGYVITQEYIYAIDAQEDTTLLKIHKETLGTERITLPMSAAGVWSVYGDVIYLTQANTRTICCFEDGAVEFLDSINSRQWQFVGQKLYYEDEQNGDLKCYDLETREITVIQERVMQFSIHEERYALCLLRDDAHTATNHYIVLDIQTGQITQLNTAQ